MYRVRFHARRLAGLRVLPRTTHLLSPGQAAIGAPELASHPSAPALSVARLLVQPPRSDAAQTARSCSRPADRAGSPPVFMRRSCSSPRMFRRACEAEGVSGRTTTPVASREGGLTGGFCTASGDWIALPAGTYRPAPGRRRRGSRIRRGWSGDERDRTRDRGVDGRRGEVRWGCSTPRLCGGRVEWGVCTPRAAQMR
jgi:hypothetical protein